MKRILAFTLSIIMILSLCSCGNDKKTEKYCSSCGEGISKDVAFCEHCGAAVNNTKTESENATSDNFSSTKSKNEGTSKPTETNKPTTSNNQSTQIHTHNYSKRVTAATCTEKGYTTYACSCGDNYKSDYIEESHSYEDYKCVSCGQLDKTHTFDILVDWVLEHGETRGNYCIVEYTDSAAIIYQKQYNYIYLQNTWYEMYNAEDDSEFVHYIQITEDITSSYYFESYMEVSNNLLYELKGYMDSKTFTNKTILKCDAFVNNISISKKELLQDHAEIYTGILESVNEMLSGKIDGAKNSGLTIKDLGFEALE